MHAHPGTRTGCTNRVHITVFERERTQTDTKDEQNKPNVLARIKTILNTDFVLPVKH